MTTLHIVNKFGLTSSALDSCLRVALPGDAILLIEDGVYNSVAPGLVSESVGAGPARDDATTQSQPTSSSIRVYALKEDLQARGIAHDSLPESIESVTCADFVTLVCEHKKSISWF